MDTVYAGRWLQVDLTSGAINEESMSEDEVRSWLAGDGMAAHRFYESLDPALAPGDPASPLLIFNGLLTGSVAPGAARTSWCGRSPLTGIWGQANMGGRWGATLRAAGLDGLAITGRAAAPVYLRLHDGRGEIGDASHLWGADTFAAHDRLRDELGAEAQVACIGPAGERQVGLAGVMTGGRGANRAAARCGIGALLGAKNLKAIAVWGHEKPTYADGARFRAAVREANALIREGGESLTLVGTAGGIPSLERLGDLPLRNWQQGSWPEGARAISGQAIREMAAVRRSYCFACPLGCGKSLAQAGTWSEGPEYETLAGFGANLLIDDLEALIAISERCNRLGLDTISTSAAVAFATEATERGLIPPGLAGGVRLRWGEPEPVLELVEQIARREGLGALLAGGVRAAATALGPGAERYAQHVKGLEVPYHDPRASAGLALNYATGARGACHLEGPSHWRGLGRVWPGWMDGPHDRFASDDEAVRLTVAFQDYVALYNALGLCKFMAMCGLDPARTLELVNAATGWGWDAAQLMRVGERLFNLKRLINLRLGVSAADDRLPRRFLEEPRPTGGSAGAVPDLEWMLPRYYALRGWDDEGRPTLAKLASLGLANV